jgi:hypothetical protein
MREETHAGGVAANLKDKSVVEAEISRPNNTSICFTLICIKKGRGRM